MPAKRPEVLSRKFFCFNELIAGEIGSLLFRDIHRQYGWGRRGKEVEGRFLGMEGGGGGMREGTRQPWCQRGGGRGVT